MKSVLLFLILVFTFSNCNDKLDWVPDKTGSDVNLDAPVVESITPAIGLIGTDTEVIIAGKNFSKFIASNIVTFNGVAAEVTHRTDTTLTVIAPKAETGPVTLEVDGREADNQPVFTYFDQWCTGYVDIIVSNFRITDIVQYTGSSGKIGYDFNYTVDISNAGALTIEATKQINVQAIIDKGTENKGAGGDSYYKTLLSGASVHYKNSANSGQLSNSSDVDGAKITLYIRMSFECETGNNQQSVIIKL